MGKQSGHSQEVRERAVRPVVEHAARSRPRFGCAGETLRNRVLQAQRSQGLKAKADQQRANEILRKA